MRSAREEFRSLVETFEPRSRAYWQAVGRSLLGLLSTNDADAVPGTLWKIWEITSACLGRVLSETFPLLSSLMFARRIKSAVVVARQDYEIPEGARPCLELKAEELKDAHKLELGRREQFTRKAQAYLMGAAVGVSFAVGMLGLAARAEPPGVPLFLKAVLVGVVLSLFMAAIAALAVIAPSEAWDLWLQEWYVNPDDDLQKKQLVKMTLLNQGYNLIAASYLAASYAAMRNGIYLGLCVLLWAIVTA